MRNGSIIVLLLVIVLLGSCKEHTQSSASKPIEITFTKEGSLEINRAADDSLVAVLDVEFAESAVSCERIQRDVLLHLVVHQRTHRKRTNGEFTSVQRS